MLLKNIPAFYNGTSPNKFFDYLAAGLPVLNNYPGWVAAIIKENGCGVVVEPDNPEDFADAVIYLRDHPNERIQMGKNARITGEKDFNRVNKAEEFETLLVTTEKEWR